MTATLTCDVCQTVLLPDAVARGEALRAKGRPVCRACSDRLGIPSDPELPRPRSATEALPPPPAPARATSAGFAVLGLAVAGCVGFGWWQIQRIQGDAASLGAQLEDLRRRADVPRKDPGAEAVRELAALQEKLDGAEKAVAALRDELGEEGRRRRELEGLLREEARAARAEADQAREALEAASRAFDHRLTEALGRLESAPAAAVPVQESPMAGQYWDTCLKEVEAFSREGRYWPASKAYDRIPVKHRRAEHEPLAAEGRKALEAKAKERAQMALKILDKRLQEGDHAYATQLLEQLEQDCGFPSVLELLRPLRDQAQLLRRDHAALQARALQEQLLLLASGDATGKQRALEGILRQGRSCTPLLVQALRHEDPQVRWGALLALGRLLDPETVGAVASGLKDPDRKVRMAAADVLAEFRDPRSIDALIAALGDEDEAVGRQAELSLERITRHTPDPAASGLPRDLIPAWKAWVQKGREAVAP